MRKLLGVLCSRRLVQHFKWERKCIAFGQDWRNNKETGCVGQEDALIFVILLDSGKLAKKAVFHN